MARRISSDDWKALLADLREEIGRNDENASERIEQATGTVPVMNAQQTQTRRQSRFTEPGANLEG